MARGTVRIKPIGARGKRMHAGKVAPTAEEKAWMDAIVDFGCIVCWLQNLGITAAEVHHIKKGDRRMGHLWSLSLCPPHHRGGAGNGLYISLHPWKARFSAAYGTEMELLEKLRSAIAALR